MSFLSSINMFFQGTALLLVTLVFFTFFSYYMPKGRKAMAGLSGAVCATFLIEVFNYWVLGNIPIIGNFTKVIGSFAGLLAAPGCAILVIILMGGNPVYALLTGTAVFAIGLSINPNAIFNAVAKTLIDTKTDFGKAAINDDTSLLAIIKWIKGENLEGALKEAFLKLKENGVLLTDDHSSILSLIFSGQHILNFTTHLKTTIGMFNILSGLIAGYMMFWVLKLIEKYSPVGLDLLVSLLVAAPLAALLALFGGNLISPLLGKIGQTVEQATRMTPIPMAIIIGGLLTIVGTSPLSSMALAVAIQLQGSAMAVGSVAAMGSSFMNGTLFAKMKYGERKNTIACAIEPLSQADIISLNPVSVYCTNFIGGALSGIFVIVYGVYFLGIEQYLFMQSSNSFEVVQGFSQQGVGLATPFGPVSMFGQGGAQTQNSLTTNSNQYQTWQLQMHLGFLLVLTAFGNVGAGLLGAYIFRHSYRITTFDVYQKPLPLIHQHLLAQIEYYQNHRYRYASTWKWKIYIKSLYSFVNLYAIQILQSFFYYYNKYKNQYQAKQKELYQQIFENDNQNLSSKQLKEKFKKQKQIFKKQIKNQIIKEYSQNRIKSKISHQNLKAHFQNQLNILKENQKENQSLRKKYQKDKKLQTQYQTLKNNFFKTLVQNKKRYQKLLKTTHGKKRLILKHEHKMEKMELKTKYQASKQKIKPTYSYLLKSFNEKITTTQDYQNQLVFT